MGTWKSFSAESTLRSNKGCSHPEIIHFIRGCIPHAISVVVQIPVTVKAVIHSPLGFSVAIPVSGNALLEFCKRLKEKDLLVVRKCSGHPGS